MQVMKVHAKWVANAWKRMPIRSNQIADRQGSIRRHSGLYGELHMEQRTTETDSLNQISARLLGQKFTMRNN